MSQHRQRVQQQQQGHSSGNDEEREQIRQQIAALQAKLDGSVPSTPSCPRGMLSPFKMPWTLDSAPRSSAKRSLEKQLALANAEIQVGSNTNANMSQRQTSTNQQPMFILCTPEQLGALSEQDSALIQRKVSPQMIGWKFSLFYFTDRCHHVRNFLSHINCAPFQIGTTRLAGKCKKMQVMHAYCCPTFAKVLPNLG